MLKNEINQRKEENDILLMTHMVLGYPSFDDNEKMVEAMSNAGVEMIEFQIPFSEPIADGPVILKANSQSIKNGTKVADCFDFAKKICNKYPHISFLFMTYYNIVFNYGERAFAEKAKALGLKGTIIPDLPPEESDQWLALCKENNLNNIYIFTPTHSDQRLKEIEAYANGFIYCVGRKGVTGTKTSFDQSVSNMISRYRNATHLPIALGFGVQGKADVDFLKGKADIAVIGSKVIQIYEKSGKEGIQNFLSGLR